MVKWDVSFASAWRLTRLTGCLSALKSPSAAEKLVRLGINKFSIGFTTPGEEPLISSIHTS